MTRKRAIALARAAVVRECPPGKLPPCWPAVERGLQLAVEAGVVIGLKKAAGRVTTHGCRIDHCPHCADAVEIRAEANRLARKLRGAR